MSISQRKITCERKHYCALYHTSPIITQYNHAYGCKHTCPNAYQSVRPALGCRRVKTQGTAGWPLPFGQREAQNAQMRTRRRRRSACLGRGPIAPQIHRCWPGRCKGMREYRGSVPCSASVRAWACPWVWFRCQRPWQTPCSKQHKEGVQSHARENHAPKSPHAHTSLRTLTCVHIHMDAGSFNAHAYFYP